MEQDFDTEMNTSGCDVLLTRKEKNPSMVAGQLPLDSMLQAIPHGLALLNQNFDIVWVNGIFSNWCSRSPLNVNFWESFDRVEAVPAKPQLIQEVFAGETIRFPLQLRSDLYLNVTISPVKVGDAVNLALACCEDVTANEIKQQKLDALHRAGQELSALDPDLLTEMTLDNRVELLKQNIRRHIHNLLHYDVIEIRLLHKESGKLEPLLEEGMTEEAAKRELFASKVGNGVTGYVAATGKSYVVQRGESDPLFIVGSQNACSSMTVALIYQDQIIGTLNVESPKFSAFGQEDVQFAELFSRELAQALYTLNLLSAQQVCTSTSAIDAINREIAFPTDAILTRASALIDSTTTVLPEAKESLTQMMDTVRSLKQRVQSVGTQFANPKVRIPKPLAGLRILIVDSEERIRKSAHAMLEKMGATVETAGTAKDAISLAKHSIYDAIISDIKHPDLGGYATYKELKQAQPQTRLVLMAGYGYDSAHTIVQAKQDGLKHLIFKPFRQEQILRIFDMSNH